MNEHEQCEAWKAELYEALGDNMPEFAGKATDDKGGFENVGFHVGSEYGDVGKQGGMVVGVTLKGADRPGKGKHVQAKGNWRFDDPEKVALYAIEEYLKLREQYK